MSRAASNRVVLALAAFAAWPRPAPAETIRLVGSSSACPSPATVAPILAPLIPDKSISSTDGALITLTDLGASHRVEVAGATRMFLDAERRCGERAKAAAVFIALALATPTPPPFGELEFGAIVHGTGKTGTAGASLRGVWRRVSLGIAAELPTTLDFGTARASLTRVSTDVSLRMTSGRIAADVGAVGSWFWVNGVDVALGTTAIGFDAGARVAVQVRLPAWRWAIPVLGVQAIAYPAPTAVALHPDGVVGHLPHFWLGATLGLVVAIP